jgi:hypothetical protein
MEKIGEEGLSIHTTGVGNPYRLQVLGYVEHHRRSVKEGFNTRC